MQHQNQVIGSIAIGIVADDCIMLVTKATAQKPMIVPLSTNPVYRITDTIAATFVGVSGDATPLASGVQRKIAQKRLQFGDEASVQDVADLIMHQMIKATLLAKPLGISALIGGFMHGQATLIQIDSQLKSSNVRVAAIGKREQDAKVYLTAHLSDDKRLTENEAVALALQAILQTDQVVAEEAEIVVMKADATFETYSLSQKRDAIENAICFR